jgi:hypothetical protein
VVKIFSTTETASFYRIPTFFHAPAEQLSDKFEEIYQTSLINSEQLVNILVVILYSQWNPQLPLHAKIVFEPYSSDKSERDSQDKS